MKNNSFSLVEVLIFTVIVSTFFIMSISIITASLRNLKYNEHKIIASHYVRQLEDWLRTQKEIDWGGGQCLGSCCSSGCSFTERATNGGLITKFCFNDSTISDWTTPDALGCNGDYSLRDIFSREVQFESSPSPIDNFISQVNVNITVSWNELGQIKNHSTKTVFSVLEQ